MGFVVLLIYNGTQQMQISHFILLVEAICTFDDVVHNFLLSNLSLKKQHSHKESVNQWFQIYVSFGKSQRHAQVGEIGVSYRAKVYKSVQIMETTLGQNFQRFLHFRCQATAIASLCHFISCHSQHQVFFLFIYTRSNHKKNMFVTFKSEKFVMCVLIT